MGHRAWLAVEIAAAVVALAAALWLLHRWALAMEARGWIHYRRRGSSGALGNALLAVQSLVEPSRQHEVEMRRAEVGEDEESGEPPPAGEGDDEAGVSGRGA